MKQAFIRIIVFVCFFGLANTLLAQTTVQHSNICGTSEAMTAYYTNNPVAEQQRQAFELFTKQYISQLGSSARKTTNDTIYIPVVFHVYGNTQGGYPITIPLIELALRGVDSDFNGSNSDYNTVHNQFLSIRSSLKIKFVLAQRDPAGNPTTGVLYYPSKAGYGNGSGYDTQIAADAWDNYKYMNVYIMYDLYNNSVYNNSGVSWYPDINMSNNKTARVVYNGVYLASNNNSVNPEFASVLTHEFAHFLNLIHTFEGGCVAPNDSVADTPPCTTAQGCHTSSSANAPLNCNNDLINAENYMDYNTTCYKMFTKGQTARMTAALQHPARITLWQDSNLVATGIKFPAGIVEEKNIAAFNIYPNPSSGRFYIQAPPGLVNDAFQITISDILGRTVLAKNDFYFDNTGLIGLDISDKTEGAYFLCIKSQKTARIFKISKLE